MFHRQEGNSPDHQLRPPNHSVAKEVGGKDNQEVGQKQLIPKERNSSLSRLLPKRTGLNDMPAVGVQISVGERSAG